VANLKNGDGSKSLNGGKSMTALQLNAANKDLRIRLGNLKIAKQMSEDAYEEKIRELKLTIKSKDNEIHMMQEYITSREAAYDRLQSEKNDLQKELDKRGRECEQLQETIAGLTARINRDSSNSSKPPSTDGFKKVIHNSRPATEKKPGGQPGHKGHTLGISDKLKQLIDSGDIPVVVEEHGNQDNDFVIRYELDIQTTVSVKEHRFHQGEDIPDRFNNPVNYGANLKALCTYLSTVGLVSAERISDMIQEMSRGLIAPSKAVILSFQKEASAHLDDELEAIRDAILDAPVINTDETPIKSTQRPSANGYEMEEAKGTTYNINVRTYSSDDSTLLTVSAHKDSESVKADNILPQTTQPIVHDHDIKYFKFGVGKHGECNIHIIRYLKSIIELTRHGWAAAMAALLLSMLALKENDLANNINFMDGQSLAKYSDEYDRIIQVGRAENSALNPKSAIRNQESNLIERLAKYKENHLLFAYDYTVPFTNNAAERDLRWIKTQQKVSGCHRSYEGAKVMARLMSFIKTLKKRKLPVLASLNDILSNRAVLASKSAEVPARS
jgi:hypothetical protein